MIEHLRHATRMLIRQVKMKDKENFDDNDDILDASFTENDKIKNINWARGFLTAAIIITVICFIIMNVYTPNGFADAVGIDENYAEPVMFCSLGVAGFCFLLFLFFRFVRK